MRTLTNPTREHLHQSNELNLPAAKLNDFIFMTASNIPLKITKRLNDVSLKSVLSYEIL